MIRNRCVLFFLFVCVNFHILSCDARKSRVRRMTGAVPAKPNEMTYLVGLYIKSFVCGGGIIDPLHVITAAHCVMNDKTNGFHTVQPFIVAALNNVSIPMSGIKSMVDKIYIPSVYNHSYWTDDSKGIQGDIAILRLKTKLDLNHNPQLSKLLLPRALDYHEDIVASLATYGNIMPNQKDKRLNIKRKAVVYVPVNNICAYLINNLDYKQMCGKIVDNLYQTRHGICQGDSGSPLVYKNTVIGVTSYCNTLCDDHDRPTVFTRVSLYLNFTRNAVNDIIYDMQVIGF